MTTVIKKDGSTKQAFDADEIKRSIEKAIKGTRDPTQETETEEQEIPDKLGIEITDYVLEKTLKRIGEEQVQKDIEEHKGLRVQVIKNIIFVEIERISTTILDAWTKHEYQKI